MTRMLAKDKMTRMLATKDRHGFIKKLKNISDRVHIDYFIPY